MMETTYITITDLCKGYKIERTYISTLREYGLLEIEIFQGNEAIDSLHLPRFEKILRFNEDLNINLEGIEVILNLLERIETQKRDLKELQNKLHIYRDIGGELQ